MNAVVNRYPCSSSRGVIVLHHNSRIRDRPTREADGHPNVKTAVQLCQSTHSGPHGQNRASLLMNPMYSIARTRQCPRKSCSPRQPMAAYMWNGLQPVTSFTLIPNPDPNPNPNPLCWACSARIITIKRGLGVKRPTWECTLMRHPGPHFTLTLWTRSFNITSCSRAGVFKP